MTEGYADPHTAPESTHKPADRPHSSTDVGPTQGHTRSRTQVRPRATRTSRTGTRAGLSAAGWEKVAAFTRHVYLLNCISERLYPTPPASGYQGRRICSRRGTLTVTINGVPPTLQGTEGITKLGDLEVSEWRGCSVSGPGRLQEEGNMEGL